MLKRHLRLQRSDDFSRLRQEGRAVHDRLFLLSHAPNGRDHNRYGFITSKALGNAVTRNRARRQLREAIRHLHPHLKPGHDIVLVGKRGMVGQPFSQISRIVEQLASKASLLVEG